MIPGLSQRRQFKDLSEQEVLALAISSEEDEASIYRWYAQRLRDDYPESARIFDEMAGEEDGHRQTGVLAGKPSDRSAKAELFRVISLA